MSTRSRRAPEAKSKRWIELLPITVLFLIGVLLPVAEHWGTFDHLRGLDKIQEVADNFNLSYKEDASMPVYPDNAAWRPLIELIGKYSKAKLRTDKQPQTIARIKATLSTKEETGPGRLISEWTSPSTPFVVFYQHWPGDSGKSIPPEEVTVVGSIGDLNQWIARSRSDFHFLINDVVLGCWL